MEILSCVYQWFADLPDTLVGVVIGSFFTLLGVILTNRTNQENMRRQMEHERKEQARERVISARRDVYLEIAPALAAAINSLMRQADLELTNDEVSRDFQIRSVSLAKVHVVASEKMALCLSEFMREFGRANLDILARRAPLLRLRQSAKNCLSEIEQFRKEQGQIIEMMKQHNLAGTMDERRMSLFSSNHEFATKQIERLQNEHQIIVNELLPKHLDLVELSSKETTRLTPLLLPTIVEVRDDLELSIDASQYKRVLEGTVGFTRQEIERAWGVSGDQSG